MNKNSVVIIEAKRTSIGSFLGNLSKIPASALGASVMRHLLQITNLSSEQISEVLLGCVLTAGQGQAPARQAVIYAGIANSVGATTINKMCGSGMKAIMLAHDLIQARPQQIILAGGIENMSQAPYLLAKAREGYRLGHGELKDHLFLDGLEDSYEKGKLMGWFAEETAKHYSLTREQQDDFARTSLSRAQDAIISGKFHAEISPVSSDNLPPITEDEIPSKAKIEKIPHLKPVFQTHGTITAANASAIADGASALMITSLAHAEHLGLTPIARIVAHSTHAQAPAQFTTAPVEAIRKVLNNSNWKITGVDLFEINEAFAVITLAAMQDLGLSINQVNIHGGACALGHPIGASGARIVTTLIHALRHYDLHRGIASLCIGGGEATALAIERM